MRNECKEALDAFLSKAKPDLDALADAFTRGWDAGRMFVSKSELGINEMVKQSHENAKAHGWWDGVKPGDLSVIPEKIALIHSEASEALEAYRTGDMMLVSADGTDNGKPVGFPSEIADIVIRIGDLCGYLGIDLADAVRVKHSYNVARPYRHGGKMA